MWLNEILDKNSIKYKVQEYDDDIYIYKVENKANVVVISSTTSIFSLDRELFYYLSNQNKLYSFVLMNSQDDKVFYLEFRDKINWLNSSFERSDKEELYFGKIVLNNQSNMENIIQKIKKY